MERGRTRSRFGYAVYRYAPPRAGRPTSLSSIYFDVDEVERPAKWLAGRLKGGGGVTLMTLHHPARPDGGVRCPISGVWNFGFAPTNVGGSADIHDDSDDVVKSSMHIDSANTTESDPFLVLAAEVKADPDWWRGCIQAGAVLKGLAEADIAEMFGLGCEAIDLLMADDEPDPRRQILYKKMAYDAVSLALGLAVSGERAGSAPVSPGH